MKKIFALFLLLLFVLSVAAIAAPAKKVVTASDSSQASGMRFGMGVYNGAGGIKFLGESFSAFVGLNFSSTSAGGASTTTFGGGGNFVFNLSGGAVPTHAGAGLTYTSFPFGAGTGTSFTLAGIYGAETTILDHFNIGVDIFPISFTSASAGGGSSTTFSLLSGTVHGAYIF